MNGGKRGTLFGLDSRNVNDQEDGSCDKEVEKFQWIYNKGKSRRDDRVNFIEKGKG